MRTEHKVGRAGVLRVIQFISDMKGEPWGKGDDEAAIRFKDGWTLLIGDLPENLLMEAAAEILKQPGRKWPTPGDLREIVKKAMPVTERPDRHAHEVAYDYSQLPLHVVEQRSWKRLAAMGCSPSYIEQRMRDRKLTREAVDRVNAMDPATLRRLGLDEFSHQQARKALLGTGNFAEMASFDAQTSGNTVTTSETPTANQPQSPLAVVGDFDGLQGGQS